jgi:hypothetical protein
MELMPMDLLDPRVDCVFKRIFGSENNKDVSMFTPRLLKAN